jgi:hypothetical protein
MDTFQQEPDRDPRPRSDAKGQAAVPGPAKVPVPLLTAVIVGLYLLHQDVWFWRVARPLVFGFLPIGLAYHAAFCLASALLMWALTRLAWPAHLEEDSRR